MQFTVRRASIEDAEAACDVLRRSIVECCVEDHGGDRRVLDAWLRNKTAENVARWFAADDAYSIVAELAGRVVGVAALSLSGVVLLCYLVPEVRYRGVGKAMLVGLEREALGRGIGELHLTSTRSGYSFYRRQGYVDEGKGESEFGLESRRMRKSLTSPIALMRVTLESPRQPGVIALIADLDAYQDTLYPAEARYALDLDSLAQPNVLFAVARDGDGCAVGCGAIVLNTAYGEVKRMYVRPEARGKGTAQRILSSLESAAYTRGCRMLMLETGPYQAEALAFYSKRGYVRCGPFGDYPDHPLSVFMRKHLAAASNGE